MMEKNEKFKKMMMVWIFCNRSSKVNNCTQHNKTTNSTKKKTVAYKHNINSIQTFTTSFILHRYCILRTGINLHEHHGITVVSFHNCTFAFQSQLKIFFNTIQSLCTSFPTFLHLSNVSDIILNWISKSIVDAGVLHHDGSWLHVVKYF